MIDRLANETSHKYELVNKYESVCLLLDDGGLADRAIAKDHNLVDDVLF